jgi:N-acetylneuraminic acid mutarotase
VFFSLPKKFSYYETQQLILGTGTAINTFLAMVLKNKIYIFSGEGKRNRKRKYNTANISGPQVKKT